MMKSQPLVSVRIPAYNHEKYMKKCLQSILDQTYQNFEIVIVDDCSSDGTVDVIRQFSDPRIKLAVHARNEGMNVTVEHIMRLCSGKYVANISSDDFWAPTKLEKQVEFLERNPFYDAVFTRVQPVGENGKRVGPLYSRLFSVFGCANRPQHEWLHFFFFSGNCLCNPSVMIKKDVYEAFGYQDKRMFSSSDFDLWVKFSFQHRFYILEDKLTS
ncbi:MAG: glycosyltransferase, partial [Firmicutes bacterium]|nr:glycosyltransferase [Bacillota bacterium]